MFSLQYSVISSKSWTITCFILLAPGPTCINILNLITYLNFSSNVHASQLIIFSKLQVVSRFSIFQTMENFFWNNNLSIPNISALSNLSLYKCGLMQSQSLDIKCSHFICTCTEWGWGGGVPYLKLINTYLRKNG